MLLKEPFNIIESPLAYNIHVCLKKLSVFHKMTKHSQGRKCLAAIGINVPAQPPPPQVLLGDTVTITRLGVR